MKTTKIWLLIGITFILSIMFLALSTQVDAVITTSDVMGWWDFQDGSGSTVTDKITTSPTNGVISNATWITGGPTNLPAGVNCDGTNDYVTIPKDYDFATSNGAIAIWYKINVAPTSGQQMTLTDIGSGGGEMTTYIQNFTGDKWLRGLTRYTSDRTIDSSTRPGLAVNQFTVYNFQSGNMSLYLNTTNVGTNVNTGSIVDQNYNLFICRLASGSGYDFNGKIHQVILFNRPIDSTEVSSLFNSGAGKTYAQYFTTTPPFTATAKDYYDNATLYNLTANITSNNDSLPYQPFDNNSLWLQLDALNQTALDSSGNSNTGTLSGWTFNDGLLNGYPTYTAGIYGGAYNLNKTGQYVSSAYNVGNKTNLSTWTIMGWFKLNNYGINEDAIYSMYQNPYFGRLNINGSGNVGMRWFGTWYPTNYTVSLNSWTHFSVVCSAGGGGRNAMVYINGSPIVHPDPSSNMFPCNTGNYSNKLYIGYDGGAYINATVDEYRLFATNLTQNQIIQEMNSAYPVNGAGLVASYSFETNFTNATGNYTYDTNNVVAGQINGSFNFDGKIGKYVLNNYKIPYESTTISLWAKINDCTIANCYLFSARNQSDDTPLLQASLQSNGKYIWQLRSSAGTGLISLQQISSALNKEYHHILFFFNKSDNTTGIFIDGILDTYTTYSGGTWNKFDNFAIGATGSTLGNSPFNGSIDDVRIYNRSLSASEVLTLYNAGKYRQYSYSTTNGTIGSTQINTDSQRVYNVSMCASDNLGYLCKSYTNLNVSTALASYLYPKYLTLVITEKDFYDNQSLSNISATFTPALPLGQSNSTTTGTLTVLLPINVTHSIDLHSTNNGGYLSRYGYSETLGATKTDYLNDTMWQSIASFSGTQKYTGASVGALQVNVTNQSNTSTLYLKAGTYTASLGATGYFVQPYTFTTTALSSQAFVVENFSNAKLNVSTLSRLTGLAVTTFNASIIALDYGNVYEQTSTTTGSVLFNLTNGTYNVTIDANGYALDSVLLYVNGSSVNYQKFNLWTTNSVNFTFVNEITGANVPNVNASLIGTLAYSFNTTSGNYYLDLISPANYKIRYGASGYTTRFGYISVTNRTSQNQTLYLLPISASGSNVTATIIDNTGYPLENALLKILKYKSSTNTYEVVSQVLSNFDGKSLFDAQLNTEFYKFIVEYPVGTVALETTPTYIYTTDLTLVVSTSDSGAENWFKYSDASTNLDFNVATNNFRYSYSDTTSSIQEACVYVYAVDNNFTSTLYNSSCSSSSSATILVGVSNITHTLYRADAYLTIGGIKSFDRQLFHQYNKSTSWGASGLLIAILITLVIVFIFVQTKDPTTIILMIPLGLTLTNVFGITHFDIWVPMALWAISLILAYIVSRR